MFKKILVPVDGSQFSELAIQKAKAIAGAFGSEVVLLNVIEITKSDYPTNPYKFSQELVRQYQNESRMISEKILNAAQTQLTGLKVSLQAVEGRAAEVILHYAKNNDIDLVIMGSGGIGGVRNMLGSVTRQVALGLEIPILIVR
ncbi:MAG: universal stress protein [Peptococcaceae bacterium]|nr:universal stress protein [Peptococcaceae bacterium]